MPREGRFYVEYLGWKETKGLYGSEFTDPIVKKLIDRRRPDSNLHRMTIKVRPDELKISQYKSSGYSKQQKISYPSQPMCDVSYVAQCLPPNTDVVGCIFLGYNDFTHCAAHVHAYRFDSADTATVFVRLVNSIIEQPDFRQRILAMEKDLIEIGHVSPRQGTSLSVSLGSDGASNECHSPNSSDSGYYPSLKSITVQRSSLKKTSSTSNKKAQAINSIHTELEHKLSLQQNRECPILLPPKDYDTIVRRHGHLSIRAKMSNRDLVRADSIFNQPSTQNAQHIRQSSQESDNTSNHSGSDVEPNIYGLYRGFKDDGYTSSSADEMAMWSPEFSFGQQSAASTSDKTSQATSNGGLRRFKL